MYPDWEPYSIHDRDSLVSSKDFARPWGKGCSLGTSLNTLPAILAGSFGMTRLIYL